MSTTPHQPSGTDDATGRQAVAEPPADHDAGALPPPERATAAVGDPLATERSATERDDRHGRIGYGRYGRFTPLALALLLAVGVVLIGRYQGGSDGPTTGIGRLVGKPAPDVTLTTLDGTPLRFADLRGDVVVLNFWASWCAPCWDEAPAFQAVHDEAARDGRALTVVGVGARTDTPDGAAAFVRDLGLTYPIGRDTDVDGPGLGPIQLAFGIPETYPSTVFLRPDGVVDDFHFGPIDADQLRDGIEQAAAAA